MAEIQKQEKDVDIIKSESDDNITINQSTEESQTVTQIGYQQITNVFSDTAKDVASRMSVLGELMQFLWARKLWWLIPMLLALGFFVLLIALAAATGSTPFIYTLF